MLDANYIDALEKRAEWLQWADEHGADTWRRAFERGAETFTPFHMSLGQGDTFFVNSKFCRLVEHALQTTPEDLAFDISWLRGTSGWMWLEQPITNNAPETFPAQAVGWVPMAEGTKLYSGRVLGSNAVGFCFFQDMKHYGSDFQGFSYVSYFVVENGDIMATHLNAALAAYPKSEDNSGCLTFHTRWVYTAFYLMAQRLSMTVRHETDRATRRRAEHMKTPVTSFIKVITLRRMEEQRKLEQHAMQVIDWQWQWEVVGHWRNQFYPSTNEHKPVFIEAYIKGPDSKPLKPTSHKIFVARR